MRSFRLCCTLQDLSSCISSYLSRLLLCCRSCLRSGTDLLWYFLEARFLPARSRSSFLLHWPCHSWCWWCCSRLLSCYSPLLLLRLLYKCTLSFRLRCISAGSQSCTSSRFLRWPPCCQPVCRHGSGPLWSSPAVPFRPVHSRSSFPLPSWFPWSCWWCCSRWLPFHIRKLFPRLPCRCMRSFRHHCILADQ